ncbi:hypothetical protein QUF72_13000, partial [Desulfobacterales bacterium HSG2]|nr:hypothetical protein [Desulfobacterales bacterium HSG2]
AGWHKKQKTKGAKKRHGGRGKKWLFLLQIQIFCFFHGNFMLLYHNLIMSECKSWLFQLQNTSKRIRKLLFATICQ